MYAFYFQIKRVYIKKKKQIKKRVFKVTVMTKVIISYIYTFSLESIIFFVNLLN